MSFKLSIKEDKEEEYYDPGVELFKQQLAIACKNKKTKNLKKLNTRKMKLLGKGAYGAAYLYFDDDTDKVLKKVYLNKNTINLEEPNSCLIDNVHFSTVYDVDIDGNVYFSSIEYVDGVTIQKLFQFQLSFDELACIFYQAIDSLEYLNHLSLLHNDIKPDNVIIDVNGVVKFIDYSLLSSKYKTGTNKYSRNPLSIVAHNSPKIESDIWSVGALLLFYFDKTLKDISSCSKQFSAEQCRILSDFIGICMYIGSEEHQRYVGIEQLKNTDLYMYVESLGGFEFSKRLLGTLITSFKQAMEQNED